MNKFYMIPNNKNLTLYKEELILPLEKYSIGFDVYFDSLEIEKIAETRKVNVIINSFLHKDDINSIKSILENMPSVNLFFIEDLGLTNIINRDKIVILQNHIINNFKSINYFSELNINNVVVSNELTKNELIEIRNNTNSNLYYYLINRNQLMYSRRSLISSYYSFKGLENSEFKKEIFEKVSRKPLIIKEENGCTSIFDKNIFSANKYISELDGYNFIINFSNLNSEETNVILEHYNDEHLSDYIDVDDYFFNNKIGYKVGDVK